ncbi:6-phosphogluconolactonase [Neobacillus sp. YIM B06451]|uniref:6-phosphogluconolactonase n=1 Tax=Neobacillus sp. YIM B06451 TaxID=3070994 RepID=UPI002930E816|nr:6-phosphogluconolactonase [Neobacillus sp. YIM B06451]
MIRIFNNEQEVALQIAKEMEEHVRTEAKPVLCLASGSTPKISYQLFAAGMKGQPALKKVKLVSLDEWVGIRRESEGSCFQMLNQDLFSHLELEPGQIEFFDGTANDLQEECSKIDSFIEEHPITFSLIGVGMNGHIGLNEPGCQVLGHSSVVDLSETTKTVAQKYFLQPTELEKGITLGLRQIAESKRAIVAITGERKAEIVKEMAILKDRKLPAQELLGYEHIDFYLDRAAAKYLKCKFIGEKSGGEQI